MTAPDTSPEAVESEVPAIKPDGYAYRYPDGYIRHSDGREINGSRPSETLPWVYVETVSATLRALSGELARARELLAGITLNAPTWAPVYLTGDVKEWFAKRDAFLQGPSHG